MALKSYRDPNAWKKSVDLAEVVCRLTDTYPDRERFGLSSQSQRAAVSIAANFAEGYGRSHHGDYWRHLSVASDSLTELETHLVIAARLNYTARQAAKPLWLPSQDVGKMLVKLTKSLNTDAPRRNPEPGTRNPGPDGQEN